MRRQAAGQEGRPHRAAEGRLGHAVQILRQEAAGRHPDRAGQTRVPQDRHEAVRLGDGVARTGPARGTPRGRAVGRCFYRTNRTAIRAADANGHGWLDHRHQDQGAALVLPAHAAHAPRPAHVRRIARDAPRDARASSLAPLAAPVRRVGRCHPCRTHQAFSGETRDSAAADFDPAAANLVPVVDPARRRPPPGIHPAGRSPPRSMRQFDTSSSSLLSIAIA